MGSDSEELSSSNSSLLLFFVIVSIYLFFSRYLSLSIIVILFRRRQTLKINDGSVWRDERRPNTSKTLIGIRAIFNWEKEREREILIQQTSVLPWNLSSFGLFLNDFFRSPKHWHILECWFERSHWSLTIDPIRHPPVDMPCHEKVSSFFNQRISRCFLIRNDLKHLLLRFDQLLNMIFFLLLVELKDENALTSSLNRIENWWYFATLHHS